jgi:hypothetical protein
MLEQTVAITNEVLEPITFVLAYPTVQPSLDQFLKNSHIIKSVILVNVDRMDTKFGKYFLMF